MRREPRFPGRGTASILLTLVLAIPWSLAGGSTDPPRTPDASEPDPLGVLPACGYPFVANLWTGPTVVLFSYYDGTVFRLVDESGTLVWSGTLDEGERYGQFLGYFAHYMTACASNRFSVLVGDSYRHMPETIGVGADDFVVDAFGLGASTHFYSYTGGNPDIDPFQPFHTIVFAYEDGTAVEMWNETGTLLWSGTLDRGQYHREDNWFYYFVEVRATKNVSLLQVNDRGYYIPSETGLFSGTHFYGWVEPYGPLQMMAYYEDTEITVTALETGALIWTGTLRDGDMAEYRFDWATWRDRAYFEITSTKPITASSFETWSSFANMDVASDAAGTRVGTDFLTLTRSSGGTFVVFAQSSGAQVEAWNASSRTLVATYALAPNEYVSIDPSGGVGNFARIRSDRPVSVFIGYPAAGSGYAPVAGTALPDLSVVPTELAFTPPAPSPGTEVVLDAIVRNVGLGTAGTFAIRFYDGRPGTGVPIGEDAFSLAPLKPSASAPASVRWVPEAIGTHEICVVADPPDYVEEMDEGNNVACRTIDVAGPILRPDYVPTGVQPPSVVRADPGSVVRLSVAVANQGNGTANGPSVLALYNESTPASPFEGTAIAPVPSGQTSPPLAANWVAPWTLGTYRIVADVDYGDAVTEWDETNNLHTWDVVVAPGPATSLAVGEPKYGGGTTYVTSVSPLTLSVADMGGVGIRRTAYGVDGGPWVDYAGPFTLSTEGEHVVTWFSEDNAGSVEPEQSAVLRVDDTPPTLAFDVGSPRHQSASLFVTSATPISAAATDAGMTPVGLASLEVRVVNSAWIMYQVAFRVAGPDGPARVELRAADHLGNGAQAVLDVVVDNTPPTTLVPPGPMALRPGGSVSLLATDAGSGVARTEYRADGGGWIVYDAHFRIPEGARRIEYRAIDNVRNVEPPRSFVVEGGSGPNYKPMIAAVFAGVLVAVGLLAAYRRPWRGRRTRSAVAEAFLVTVLPFAAAEAVTGLVSLATGALAIPPLLGFGTAVDVGILVPGLVVTGLRFRHPSLPDPRAV